VNRDFTDLKKKSVEKWALKKEFVNRHCTEFEDEFCGNVGVEGMLM
jgi:hypothetical protein